MLKNNNIEYSQRCLSNAETDKIVAFINERRTKFPTKLACFQAALEHIGATKRISATSSTVTRYFDKADKRNSADVPAKRKYTRRQIQPESREVRVNFCPNCGCNIHAVATGLAMDKIA